MTVLDFELAGFSTRVEVNGAAELEPLGGGYSELPRGALHSDLVLRIERRPSFPEGREKSFCYPAFTTRLAGRRLELERYDARGWLDLAASPLRGDFVVGQSRNSAEAAIRIALSVGLPRRGALILHSSAVADARGAHVFSGVSGAGKSTIAALLSPPSGLAIKVADELLVLARGEGGWRVLAAPFIGARSAPPGASFPLSSINILEQALCHERQPLSSVSALRELMRHVLVYARDPETAAHVLGAVGELATAIPFFRLRFAKDPSVAEVLGLPC